MAGRITPAKVTTGTRTRRATTTPTTTRTTATTGIRTIRRGIRRRRPHLRNETRRAQGCRRSKRISATPFARRIDDVQKNGWLPNAPRAASRGRTGRVFLRPRGRGTRHIPCPPAGFRPRCRRLAAAPFAPARWMDSHPNCRNGSAAPFAPARRRSSRPRCRRRSAAWARFAPVPLPGSSCGASAPRSAGPAGSACSARGSGAWVRWGEDFHRPGAFQGRNALPDQRFDLAPGISFHRCSRS